MDNIYYCTGCNEWKKEDDFETKQTFAQTMESPAEYENFCNDCDIMQDSCLEFDLNEVVDLLNEKEVRI